VDNGLFQTTAGRRLTIYPPIHIVVAYTSQILLDIKDSLVFLQQNTRSAALYDFNDCRAKPYSDIEKTLVLGAHGPKELVLFLVEDHADA
jgi:L-lactate dehydrogenase complex protein LldG